MRHDVRSHDGVSVEEPDPLAAEVAVVADLPENQKKVAFVVHEAADEVGRDHPLEDLAVVVDLGEQMLRID